MGYVVLMPLEEWIEYPDKWVLQLPYWAPKSLPDIGILSRALEQEVTHSMEDKGDCVELKISYHGEVRMTCVFHMPEDAIWHPKDYQESKQYSPTVTANTPGIAVCRGSAEILVNRKHTELYRKAAADLKLAVDNDDLGGARCVSEVLGAIAEEQRRKVKPFAMPSFMMPFGFILDYNHRTGKQPFISALHGAKSGEIATLLCDAGRLDKSDIIRMILSGFGVHSEAPITPPPRNMSLVGKCTIAKAFFRMTTEYLYLLDVIVKHYELREEDYFEMCREARGIQEYDTNLAMLMGAGGGALAANHN